METRIIPQAYSQARERLLETIVAVHELAARMQSTWQETAAELVKNIHAPFLFVVVGEVKSGKSSLVNALLGENVCEVAPDPCTDVIQKIVYAATPYERSAGPSSRERGLSREVLKDIAIVDTPGTNSILESHQALTERFIPQSDLVLFVFQALNPYPKTAWDLFDFVNARWHKKIVFVMQQADRATEQELQINQQRVEEYALERGMAEPRIFTVSAKKDMESSDEGLASLRGFIQETVTGGKHYQLKLESLISTATEVLAGLARQRHDEEAVLAEDRKEAELIKESLDRGKQAALSEMALLKARLLEAYDRTSSQTVAAFAEGLSVPAMLRNTFKNLFGKKNSLKEWVESLHKDFEKRFTREVEMLAAEASGRASQHLARLMESLMDQLRRSQPRHVGLSALAEQRMEVLDAVAANVLALLGDESIASRMRPANLHSLGDRALVGGFLTAAGALLAASIHAVAFDVTGGVLATVGALLAIHTVVFRRSAAIKGFREGFAEGREQLERELDQRLNPQVESIFAELAEAFRPFHEHLASREATLRALREEQGTLSAKLEEMGEELSSQGGDAVSA